jgi:hypothetical protein
MTNEPFSESYSENLSVYAICIYCNKRFTSMRSISMHLKGTANRHAVNFVNRKQDLGKGAVLNRIPLYQISNLLVS